MADLTREQVIDIIDQIASEWDGCEYESPGEAIDIGNAVRVAGYRRVHALFDAPSPAHSMGTLENAAYIAACSPEVILRLVRIAQAAESILPMVAECQEIARRWEPDNSSGKERQWLVRGRFAAATLREALGDKPL